MGNPVKKKRVLFLNPPGKEIYIRDYYCSKVSKAYYLPQPVDLLVQTSFFDYDRYELKVVDAIAERWNKSQCLKVIKEFEPQFVIGQFGSASFEEDQDFYSDLCQQVPDCKILCSGDMLLEEPEDLINDYHWLDAIITDFYKPGPLNYVKGGGDKRKIDGLVVRQTEFNGESKEFKYQKIVDISTPKHELFSNHKYRMPFAAAYPMATVLTNYACPYPCTFCIMSHLEFKSRSADSIIKELEALKEMGIKFIYFSDQTFYTIPKVIDEVLDYMIENDLGLKWMCFSRVDIMTESRLTKMKKAGCQIIMYGVEWAEDEYLQRYKKQYTVEQVKTAFELTRKVGIKRLGTFLMGVPGQDEESIRNTVKFAKEID
ncbi:MAG: radical SAM protein, partial [Bacteroidota bacterium]